MAGLPDASGEEKLGQLVDTATEVRRLLLGMLLIGKGMWKDTLEQTAEGVEMATVLKDAEETFVDSSIFNPLEELENTLSVIHKRARAVFVLLDYISRCRK
ncbi:hypothetical protein [Syntrophorhabdus aromaticivorans]|uniref:hypothetical protein n=1 Tax=Syntrophorhabdus aromaticivorans TaxID=328301 RepID=UPI0003FB9A96|nr:hypothetical protein [Syntrophorhabdus aromaticivorans]